MDMSSDNNNTFKFSNNVNYTNHSGRNFDKNESSMIARNLT